MNCSEYIQFNTISEAKSIETYYDDEYINYI